MIAIPVLGVVFIIAADFVHPIFLLLLAVPVFLIRIYSIKLGLAKCPRCSQFYNGDPRRPFEGRPPGINWGLLDTGSRCVNCGFAL